MGLRPLQKRCRDTAIATFVTIGVGITVAAGTSEVAARTACEPFADVPTYTLAQADARSAIVCLLNHERNARGLPVLDRNRKLQRSAQKHNDVMLHARCFSHQCQGEQSLERRLRSVGYLRRGFSRWSYAENIGAYGAHTPRDAVTGWMNSAGHRANILKRRLKDVGVGVSYGNPFAPGVSRAATVTTDFGFRKR